MRIAQNRSVARGGSAQAVRRHGTGCVLSDGSVGRTGTRRDALRERRFANVGELEAFWPQALRLDPTIRDTMAPHMLLLEEVRRRADEFDVLHFHIDYYPFSLFARQPVPFLTTMHGVSTCPNCRPIFNTFSDVAGGVDFGQPAPAADGRRTGCRPFITACRKTC